ncbi:hypothetical protein [Nocardia sp. NRRL S-836]|nr:hypothetical protein [Nocardia sp. NRRL S-836]
MPAREPALPQRSRTDKAENAVAAERRIAVDLPVIDARGALL